MDDPVDSGPAWVLIGVGATAVSTGGGGDGMIPSADGSAVLNV